MSYDSNIRVSRSPIGAVAAMVPMGGRLLCLSPLDPMSVAVLDIATLAWSEVLSVRDISFDRHTVRKVGHSTALMLGYCRAGGSMRDASVVFDTSPLLARVIHSRFRPRAAPAVVKMKDGRLLVCGGDNWDQRAGRTVRSASVDVYDPVSGTWSAAPDLPGPRADARGALAHDGSIVVFGGLAPDPTDLMAVDVWRPSPDLRWERHRPSWTRASRPGQVFSWREGVPLQDGSVLLFLEAYEPPNRHFEIRWMATFHPATGVWSEPIPTPMLPPRSGPGPSAVLFEERVWIPEGLSTWMLSWAPAERRWRREVDLAPHVGVSSPVGHVIPMTLHALQGGELVMSIATDPVVLLIHP